MGTQRRLIERICFMGLQHQMLFYSGTRQLHHLPDWRSAEIVKQTGCNPATGLFSDGSSLDITSVS